MLNLFENSSLLLLIYYLSPLYKSRQLRWVIRNNETSSLVLPLVLLSLCWLNYHLLVCFHSCRLSSFWSFWHLSTYHTEKNLFNFKTSTIWYHGHVDNGQLWQLSDVALVSYDQGKIFDWSWLVITKSNTSTELNPFCKRPGLFSQNIIFLWNFHYIQN